MMELKSGSHYENKFSENSYEKSYLNSLFNKISINFYNYSNSSNYNSTNRMKINDIKENENNNNNMLNDILGIINSKVITASIIKPKPKKIKKKFKRRFSCVENVINEFKLTNKFFPDN